MSILLKNSDIRPAVCRRGDVQRSLYSGGKEMFNSGRSRLHTLIEQSCDKFRDRTAVICGTRRIPYGELDRRANQLARHLLALGIHPGDRVGILLHRSLQTYVSLLAILKAGAVFVPMDVGFPGERIDFITRDAGLVAILTSSDCPYMPEVPGCALIQLDHCQQEIDTRRIGRIGRDELQPPTSDQLCYIIYTSGSTGYPKGVAIEHASICNFVQVAADVYDIKAGDRVYQGMTIAFDFSIEEIWLGWSRGAALVAGPTDDRRLGSGLADFLTHHRVTVFCCIPTLLATLDRDIPSLRTLIVGGEACPRSLVERWARSGRRMLNTYGPTEATVTASWGELVPGRPVTIGRAMPTYTIYILDESGQPVADSEVGEICIAGIGLARGYVNLPEKTTQAFIPDTLDTPDNPSGRIYRTGDLGRVRIDGEIEYLGRMDTQVKIRGYRIELTEIESVILASSAASKAVVAPYAPANGVQELVAYCELKSGCAELDEEELAARLRSCLPAYMVPAFLEILDSIPLLANGKADRKKLPPPTGRRLAAAGGENVAPTTPVEKLIARELASLLGVEQVSVTGDFFLDLGAHSLIVARLVSILRKDPAMSCLGLGDLYHYPTIRKLAGFIQDQQAKAGSDTGRVRSNQQSIQRVTDSKVWVCGVAQLLLLTLITALYALPGLAILDWMAGHVNWTRPDYLQIGYLSSLAIVLSLVFSLAVPVVMKWVLLGRVKPGIYPLWGWFFLRFWLVDKMAAMAPLAFFSGTPMLSAYYRLLGARIGKNVILASPLLHLPDLVIIGHGTAINTGSHIFCYHVQNNRLHIAPVHIGKDCVIGSSSVLMPGAQMEDAAVLGDQSLLGTEERIPANGVWRGSPARLDARAGNRKNSLSEVGLGRPGQWLYFCCGILLFSLVPLAASFPAIVGVLAGYQIFGDYGLLVSAPFAGLSFVFCLHGLIVLLKKVVLPATSSGRYPVASLLYIRKWFVDRLMELSLGMSNSLYATLYLSPFLRLMGAKIGRLAEISTISHITPDLLEIGDESFVADIAHVGPTVVANGLFTLAPVRIGRRSFIGNAALVPGGTTVGKNALIGVLSVPPGSEVPAETTWLGSPPLHLPEREQSKFFPEHFTFAPTRNLYIRRLCYEYFRVTLPATLAFIGVTVLGQFALHLLAGFSLMAAALLLALAAVVMGVCLTAVVAGLKWLLIGTYRPRIRPMWSAFVWRSELITALYENVVVTWLLARLTGTPFMALVLRLFGVKIGSRCFLETTFMTEFDLVEIGDDCCIGLACSLQTHLFEDRVMKMSRLRIGDSCSIGPRAVILYDAILEQEVTLDALSLVMKGETLAAATCWHGSPARNR